MRNRITPVRIGYREVAGYASLRFSSNTLKSRDRKGAENIAPLRSRLIKK